MATANEIKEAYCRDIDAFSADFNVDPQRPQRCEPVPRYNIDREGIARVQKIVFRNIRKPEI